MAKVMVLTTVPNTAEMARSSASLATTTVTATATVTKAVTATVTKTMSSAARTSFYSSTKLSKSAVPSAVPDHLMTRVMDLMSVTGFNKSSLIAGAVQIGLGTVIIHGFKLAWSRLPVESVPPGEDPKRWKDKVRFAYNFLKNAAGDNERLRRDIEKARQETHLARQNELFAQKYSFGAPMDKQGLSPQDNVLLAKAHTDKLRTEQPDADEAHIDAEPATTGPDPEDLRHQLTASDMARNHVAEQLKQLQESSQRERHDLQSEVDRLKSELAKSQRSNSELRGDLEEAHQHADGLENILEYTEVKLEEEKEYVVVLKELEEDQHDFIVDLLKEVPKFAASRQRVEKVERQLRMESARRQNAEIKLFRQAENELRKSRPAGADAAPPSAPDVFRFMKDKYGNNASPLPAPSSVAQTPNVADSSAALSEASDKSTPSLKRRRNPKASKADAMPNKRRASSPEETYGDMASESESMDLEPALPAPDKALDLTNVPRLARPDEASSMALRAPAPAPAAAPVTAPPATARRGSRVPVAAPTPGRELRNRTAVNYAEGSRRSAQPQNVSETPAARRRGAPSVTPAPETARRVTRSQSPTKGAPARR